MQTVASGTSKRVFHWISLLLLSYPYYWIQKNPSRVNTSYGWHFQMFTILTLTLAYIQFAFCVLSDAMPGSKFLRSAKRTALLIAAPCETLVSTLYWPIKLYDATLLAPEELMKLFPMHADLSMHAVPTLLLLLETFVFSEAFETGNSKAFLAYAIYGTGYYYWTERNARLNGWYPYPMYVSLSLSSNFVKKANRPG